MLSARRFTLRSMSRDGQVASHGWYQLEAASLGRRLTLKAGLHPTHRTQRTQRANRRCCYSSYHIGSYLKFIVPHYIINDRGCITDYVQSSADYEKTLGFGCCVSCVYCVLVCVRCVRFVGWKPGLMPGRSDVSSRAGGSHVYVILGRRLSNDLHTYMLPVHWAVCRLLFCWRFVTL